MLALDVRDVIRSGATSVSVPEVTIGRGLWAKVRAL